MNEINAVALFRLSVLGPLVSPEQLQRGELQTIIGQLAQREYAIPDSDRRLLGEKTIQAWYYLWRKGGIDALVPKVRVDRGQSKIAAAVQEAILAAKRENPRRSINQIERLLVAAGRVADSEACRAPVFTACCSKTACRRCGARPACPRRSAASRPSSRAPSGTAM